MKLGRGDVAEQSLGFVDGNRRDFRLASQPLGDAHVLGREPGLVIDDEHDGIDSGAEAAPQRLELCVRELGSALADVGAARTRLHAEAAPEAIAGLPRLQARAACASPVRMVALIGIPDLNAMQRLALGQISQRVVALVHAPAEHAERFDDLGCVIAEAWREQPPPIDDANIIVAEGPADQAQEALRLLSRLGGGGRLAPSQITIGLGDAGLAPTILCHAEWAGVAVRAAAANALGQSPPYRALQAIATWLADQRFATFAALLRHPDVEDWVIRRCAAPGAGERVGKGEAGSPQRAVQSSPSPRLPSIIAAIASGPGCVPGCCLDTAPSLFLQQRAERAAEIPLQARDVDAIVADRRVADL